MEQIKKIKSRTVKHIFKPLTQSTWNDFEKLFGEHGACGGCWCMWWRITRAVFEKQKGIQNKIAMQKIVDDGCVPGILAFHRNRAIGWCSIAPRDHFPVLQRSRILKPIDDKPVWSIVCFFIEKTWRNKGITKHLIEAAVDYAYNQGAMIVEAYPIIPRSDKVPDIYAYTGFFSTFEKAGFREEIRRSKSRSIMRRYLDNISRSNIERSSCPDQD